MSDPTVYTYSNDPVEKPNLVAVAAATRRYPTFRSALMNTTALQSINRRG
jgi:hypothetical protein